MKLFQLNNKKINNLNPGKKFQFTQISDFSKNSHIYIPLQIFFLILALSFIIIGIFYRSLPPQIPFYYSLPWGEEQLAQNYYILLLPGFALVIFLVNFIITLLISKKDLLLAQIILWSTCFVALLALITLIRIIVIVT